MLTPSPLNPLPRWGEGNRGSFLQYEFFYCQDSTTDPFGSRGGIAAPGAAGLVGFGRTESNPGKDHRLCDSQGDLALAGSRLP